MSSYENWRNILYKISYPVLNGFANKNIHLKAQKQFSVEKKKKVCNDIVSVEMFCRTIMGINPLLSNTSDISEERLELLNLTEISFKNCFQNNYIDWDIGDQLLVEMANLCFTFINFPYIWNKFDYLIKKAVLHIVKKSNCFDPHQNNWILFKCIVEIFLFRNGILKSLENTKRRLKDFENKYYVGDGFYSDGDFFHADFYNSYVILPFLIVIYKEIGDNRMYNLIVQRIKRQSEYLERLINHDGTYPTFGRSAVYRTGIFHALAYCSQLNILPESISYGQVRCGLEKVIKKTFNNEDNFSENRFLHLGFSGHQPEIADAYSNNGSVYYCLVIFIVLGLNEDNVFWKDSEKSWTQKKLWITSESVGRDKYIKELISDR